MKKFSSFAVLALLASTALSTLTVAQAQAQEAPQSAQETVEEEEPEEIVVRGVRIPDEKKQTSEISSVLDEASFVRTGDSDIGGALRRVTGLSLNEGRFVIVRGLNERYSSVTLDGSPLPSPEPLRRVVPLDIIPTTALSGALVQKTYSPEFSAEFGGGVVALRSRAIPNDAYFQIGVSGGFDTATTGRAGLTHDGGELDFLGFDDGTRSVPGPLAACGPTGGAFGNLSACVSANQDAIDSSLSSPETEVIFERQLPPNYNVDLAFGGKRDLSSLITVGGNIALSFGNTLQTRRGRREQGFIVSGAAADSTPFNVLPGDFPNTATSADFTSTQQIAQLNGVGSFGIQFGENHEITSTSVILRSTLKDTRLSSIIQSPQEAGNIEIVRENIEFFERQVWQTQLRGEHEFPGLSDLSVNWRAAYGRAFRDAPFQRQTERGRANPGGPVEVFFDNPNFGGSFFNESLSLTFSEVQDENFDLGIDFELPLSIVGQAVDLKVGYNYTDKQRDVFTRQFVAAPGSLTLPPAVFSARPDVLFSPGVAGTGALDFTFINNDLSLDNADSGLQVHAGYIGVEAELGRFIRIAAGGRYENGVQVTNAFATNFPNGSFTQTRIDEDYLLPAATLTWLPIGDLQVRVGYSQTITRPQFRELTPAIFLDDETDLNIIGNPFLQNTEIDNIDARIEYYFGRGQFVTLGGFYKDISQPIETTSTQLGGEEFQTFVNAPSAELYGFEFEFERLFPLNKLVEIANESSDFVLRANYTWSQSSVSADGTVTTAVINSTGAPVTPTLTPTAGFVVGGRSLQGQSNHLFNLQLGVEDLTKNLRATLLVNWASRRIRQTANIITGAPDVFERPPFSLDFVFTRTINTKFAGAIDIGFKVQNLLADDYEAFQEFEDGTSALFDSFQLGRVLSTSISKRF
jgi:TonB-dependent receptor